jgi:hypothetical protein
LDRLEENSKIKKLKILSKDYNSIYKIGEYEFLVKFHYMPLFMIAKLVRVTIQLMHPKANSNSFKMSSIVRHSESGKLIQMFISSYLDDAGYFKLK